ncbi:MAG: 50S ribosomal protein L10 [Candidatus Pacearchaeota archaeon]
MAAQQTKTQSGNTVPKKKIEEVNQMESLMKNSRTILVASIKNIPSSQFQEIVKKLRGTASVKVPKKSLLFRALENYSSEEIEKLKNSVGESFALLFSNQGPFELAKELIKNQRPAAAKPGQEAPEDIEIEEGETDLPPGPAISELGNLGLKTQVQKGKIYISESKVIAKKGEEISQGAADVMSKLEMKPFKIGFIPLCAYDSEEGVFYEEISIDVEGAKEAIKESYSKALAFAVEMSYASSETINFLIGKAAAHEKALENKLPSDESHSESVSEQASESQESSSSESFESSDESSNEESSSEETEKSKKEEGEDK